MNTSAALRRRLLVPEVVQTSAMDCGPASLKCLLEGFDIRVSYGRLREACQTHVDGTSIDTMEEVAVQLGLDAEQVLLPADHLFLPEVRSLPAIMIVRRPSGEAHFTVAWRRHGHVVQLMDPARGRRWPTQRQFLDELYQHEMAVPAHAWRKWAGTEENLAPLRYRLRQLGVARGAIDQLLIGALADAEWRGLAALDAATRLMEAIVRARGLRRGRQTSRVLQGFVRRERDASAAGAGNAQVIPPAYWLVRPAIVPEGAPRDEELILVRGAVLVRARRPAREGDTRPGEGRPGGAQAAGAAPSAELLAALKEAPTRPWRELVRLLRLDGVLTPVLLIAALVLAALGVVGEALLFRAFLEAGHALGVGSERLGAAGVVIIFAATLLFLELPLANGLLRAGRKLEARLRLAFLDKIPRLTDRYFHSRPTSDMAERGHSIHALRFLPTLGGQLVRATCTLLLTVAGIAWLDPQAAPLAVLAAALAIGLPLMAQPLLNERDMRVRTHAGALSRFYLDAMLGVVAIRTHGAERSVRREHESLLSEWVRAGLRLQRSVVGVDAVLAVSGFGLAAWLLFDHWHRVGESGSVLLLLYWALSLPAIGQEIAQMARQYPSQRNLMLRLWEPLGALEDADAGDEPASSQPAAAEGAGIAIDMQDVAIRAAGYTILEEVNLSISPGEHVAIVGPSGAGKSSLVGLLLGWHRAATGRVLVNGSALSGAALCALRRATAWVDPGVQLWNRSLIDNLLYGVHPPRHDAVSPAIEQADLLRVLQNLPDGLQSPLGENGAFLSGGEGQRVRLGRAMLRGDARLVILDEPFRGLDHAKRQELLARARRWWRDSTLLCITHDVADTAGFDRVVVVEGGRIVEQGVPQQLLKEQASSYGRMVAAEQSLREGLWSDDTWRRWHIAEGVLTDRRGGSTP